RCAGAVAARSIRHDVRPQHRRHQPPLVGRHQGGGHRAWRPGLRRCRRGNSPGWLSAMAIVLQASLRGLFYAPYYAALALGAYEREGIEVHFVSAVTPGAAPNALFDGSADVSWGGPMRVNQLYQERADCDLVCFGEAVTRAPFLLVGREPR